MLAAYGYTEDRIITNDNGTQESGFTYDELSKRSGWCRGDILILNLKNPNKN